jgi:hypothetical protein
MKYLPASVRNSLLIVAMVAIAAQLSYLATISHGIITRPQPAVIAALVTLMGMLPPLHFGRLLGNGAANQLAVVAWRMGIMLPAVAIATRYDHGQRKCYLIALLACYFVSLLLESWLLIRGVRRNQAKDF